MAKKDLLNIKEFPPTVEQFRRMDECVVHINLKYMGRTYMAGDATIWHVVDSDVGFGQIASNGNIYQGAIMRTSIDKVMSVPNEEEVESNEELIALREEVLLSRELIKTMSEEMRKVSTWKEQLSKYGEMITEIQAVIDDYGDILIYIERDGR